VITARSLGDLTGACDVLGTPTVSRNQPNGDRGFENRAEAAGLFWRGQTANKIIANMALLTEHTIPGEYLDRLEPNICRAICPAKHMEQSVPSPLAAMAFKVVCDRLDAQKQYNTF
jgi:hypothetical protein